MLRLLPLAALCAAVALAAAAPAAQTYLADNAFPGVSFSTPVNVTWAPGAPDRAYVVEQGVGGPPRVRTVASGTTAVTTYLDLTGRVLAGGEQGLLGMAFHPDYATNGRVYMSYTAGSPRRSVVSEFTRSATDPLTADPASERVLLTIPQPFSNHNGGHILFGPDGLLYIAIGDGGSGGDPQNNAQNRATLLGKLLRIDVDARTGSLAYGVPPGNPFAGNASGFREEIYAYGLRNSWKFSFDSATGDLWLGDVGQGEWEEIDLITSGGNYGWNVVEGPECFLTPGCDQSPYVAPVFWYDHGANGGQSITGGFVYHGTAAPSLAGRYLYADFINPRFWALDVSGPSPVTRRLTLPLSNVAAIIEGPDGEAYPVSYNGTVYRLREDLVAGAPAASAPAVALRAAGPQPFGPSTAVEATVAGGGHARVTLHDALGRTLAVLHDGPAAAGQPLRLGVDGARLPAGVFLVRLESGDHAAVLRLTHVR